MKLITGGMTDYNAAIRSSVKQCADTGIAYIDFDSGYIRRLDSQVRMNVLEGVRTSAIEVNKAVGEEFGADGYEISAHGLCAPDHLPYQGRQYSAKEYDSLISTLVRPFGTLNCKHVAFAILMGISEPTYDQEELDEIAKTSTEEISVTLGKNPDGTDNVVTKTRYQWSQEQRRIETEIRRQKDRAVLAGQSGDMSTRRQAQLSINNYKGQYKTISDAANLSERTDLMSKSGYHWVKAENELKLAKIDDIMIGRSIGAKAKNYWVEDKRAGISYQFMEGTYIRNPKVFAGYKGVKPLNEPVVEGLVAEFGGDPQKWQHAKGIGELNVDGESILAEVHWFSEESVGKVKFKVKEWLE